MSLSSVATTPGRPFVLDFNDSTAVHAIKQRMETDFSFLKISRVDVQGTQTLRSEYGGLRIFCLYRGEGEVFLPRGYRTCEGDGLSLPKELYAPDPIDPAFMSLLLAIREEFANVSEAARLPLNAILSRLNIDRKVFCGDITGDLWRLLEQTPRPWASDPNTETCIDELFHCYREQGFSTKITDSWEPVMGGDQLLVCGGETLEVRGNFSCFSMENTERHTSHISAVRRLRHLLDTAGGCNPGFDPFRRLPTTWFPNYPGESGDGLNFFNNHIVNIPAENSPTHFHPRIPIGGGMPQTEFYLVLDPAVYHLESAGEEPYIILYPDLGDLSRFEKYHLKPGMFVYIPPGVAHRGLNVFAMIMTIPGFKPGNELYIDRDIYEQAGDLAPWNENHLSSKNYERLEDYL